MLIFLFSDVVVANFIVASPNITATNFVLQNNGSISDTEIVLSLAQSSTGSAVYWKEAQNVLFGFKTSLTYVSSDCDSKPSYNGGDGFTFFVSSLINTTEPVTFGGSLGIVSKTNIAVIGFDFLIGRIIYNATTGPTTFGSTSTLNVLSGTEFRTWRCTAIPIDMEIEYTPPTFVVRRAAINYSASFQLNLSDFFGSQMYVGLSAATGTAYMRQVMTRWEYTSNPPPEMVPYLECYEKLNDSTYVAHLGYDNKASSSVQFNVGTYNSFNPAPQGRGQPTVFQSGRSQSYPLNAFSLSWDGSELTWNLSSNFVTFSGSNTAHLCPTSLNIAITFATAQNLTANQLAATLSSIANFLGISPSRVTFQNVNYEPITKRSALLNGLQGTLELEIGGTNSQTQNEPSAADSVQKFVERTSNSTLANQVLNPTGTENIEFISTNPKSTGVEGTGTLVRDDPAPLPSPIPTPVPIAPTAEPLAIPATEIVSVSFQLAPSVYLIHVLICAFILF
eukprot:TRINITY_DN5660_c0_g1_i1.p1 TRINITY_DN5660_c0_g1~~TRINITY_DN5660_c0_g1_i1.p1  ORF type:complete len:506 (-),score=27.19 TRINITY_DN5660_c0_g1_i1:1-1518(-)